MDYPFSNFTNLEFSSNPPIESSLKNRKLVSAISRLGYLENNKFLTSGILCGAAMIMMTNLDENIEKKLKIENLTRCCSCKLFQKCKEPFKEDIVDCDHFSELPENEQIVIVRLAEFKL